MDASTEYFAAYLQWLISTRQVDLSNRINLYRVLGGGLADTSNENMTVAVTPEES